MNQTTKTVKYGTIGLVHYKPSNIVKRTTLRIKADTSIHVTYPISTGFDNAEKFVLSKELWIEKSLNKVKKRIPEKKIFSENILNITRFHNLEFSENTLSNKIFLRVTQTAIQINHPSSTQRNHPLIQDAIRKGITIALKREAVSHITPRIKALAEKNGLPYKELTFRDTKTRWGSCSGRNNISLNIQLMRLPDELIDYVILHELAHIKHKNHSAAFRTFLDKMLPKSSRFYDRELRKFSTHS